jgi:sec-independent protein translocase protein TatB
MFGVDSTELLLITVAALIFIGPKDLPKAMRTVGAWVRRIRDTARHFTAGLRTMVRDAELEEMERKWREETELNMRLNSPGSDTSDPQQPAIAPPLVPGEGDPMQPAERPDR